MACSVVTKYGNFFTLIGIDLGMLWLNALDFCDLPSVIKFMKTPKKASQKYTYQMRDIRRYASSILAELQTVQARVNEAILLLEESHEGHEIGQLPQLPVFDDVPDPSTLQLQTLTREESPLEEIKEEDIPARWPTTLDMDVFKPV